MNNELEHKRRSFTYRVGGLPSSILATASQVMQDLHDNKPRSEIIKNLNGDVELFKMVSLFLYSNKSLTRQNAVTKKGRAWLQTVSELDLPTTKHASSKFQLNDDASTPSQEML
jgi:hypothetical protein